MHSFECSPRASLHLGFGHRSHGSGLVLKATVRLKTMVRVRVRVRVAKKCLESGEAMPSECKILDTVCNADIHRV